MKMINVTTRREKYLLFRTRYINVITKKKQKMNTTTDTMIYVTI